MHGIGPNSSDRLPTTTVALEYPDPGQTPRAVRSPPRAKYCREHDIGSGGERKHHLALREASGPTPDREPVMSLASLHNPANAMDTDPQDNPTTTQPTHEHTPVAGYSMATVLVVAILEAVGLMVAQVVAPLAVGIEPLSDPRGQPRSPRP